MEKKVKAKLMNSCKENRAGIYHLQGVLCEGSGGRGVGAYAISGACRTVHTQRRGDLREQDGRGRTEWAGE